MKVMNLKYPTNFFVNEQILVTSSTSILVEYIFCNITEYHAIVCLVYRVLIYYESLRETFEP